MKTKNFNILDLIPQRPPMVMVDNLISCNENITITKLLIRKENIFCSNGFFTEPGLIENIAQSAAARVGYFNKLNDTEPLIGFIGAIKELNIFFLPKELTEINTEITIESEILGFTLIHGKIFSDNKIVASCEMRIFIKQ